LGIINQKKKKTQKKKHTKHIQGKVGQILSFKILYGHVRSSATSHSQN